MSDDRSGTSDDLKTNGRLSFDVKKLGKAGRAINIYSKYDLSESRDFLDRISDMHYAKSDVLERLKYDMRYRAFKVSASFAYTEPIATKWSLFFSETFRYDFSGNKTLAREKLTEIVRDDLSSDSNINNYRLTENLLIKYRNKISLHVGASVEHLKTTNSLWQVISSQRMENRFVTNVSPYIHIQSHSQSQYVQFYVGADAIPISSMEVFPAVVKLTPSDMQTGNIFLHQPYANEFNFSYTRRADKITCDFLYCHRYKKIQLSMRTGLTSPVCEIRFLSIPRNHLQTFISIIQYGHIWTRKSNCSSRLPVLGSINCRVDISRLWNLTG